MKYLSQSAIIFGFTFLGELLHTLIPLPIPAAIYGLLLLFLALLFKIVKPEQISGTAKFLIAIMGILFVAPGVSLLESWQSLSQALIPICVVTVLSTVLVFGVSGRLTQLLLGKGNSHE